MTKLYVIRHAEAEGNIYRRIHGHYDSRITSNGLRQIRALERRFAAVPIDAVYASDLNRAMLTAQAISRPKGLSVQAEPRLREVALGDWEDVPFGYPETFAPEQIEAFYHDTEHWQIPGAESYETYTGRFIRALADAASAHPGGSVAVVTHGMVSTGGFRRLFGDLMHQASRCDNTGVSLIEYEDGCFTPVWFYDNSHLTPEISTLAHQLWWRGKGGFNLWFRPAEAKDRSLFDPEFYPQKGHEVQIALLGDKPVGYLAFRADGPSCLYLLPAYRHKRYGDQLLGQVVCTLRGRGADTLRIGVPTCRTEALAFFARHGGVICQMDDVFTVYELDIRPKQI